MYITESTKVEKRKQTLRERKENLLPYTVYANSNGGRQIKRINKIKSPGDTISTNEFPS
jgi:hypothetical protein